MPYPSLKFKFKAGLGKAETALHDSMYCKYRNKSNIQVTYYIYGYNLDERARDIKFFGFLDLMLKINTNSKQGNKIL